MRVFFQKYWFLVSILVLLFFSLFIRIIKLDQIPAGMTWDEAAIGYNGYAIWETRRDEWLVKLPISFRSFGDYKAPLAIYLNGFFTYFLSFEFFKKSSFVFLQNFHLILSNIFWLNLWTVRLPFVLAGLMGILGYILLIKNILIYFSKANLNFLKKISILGGLMFSISPWFFHFTRAGFESGMSLTFLIWMQYFLLKFLHSIQLTKVRIGVQQYVMFILSILCLSASMYTYHSAKIVAPLIFISTLFIFLPSQAIFQKKILALLFGGLLLSGILLKPMITDTLNGSGGERFSQTSVFSSNFDSTPFSKFGIVINNYLHHLSPNFLFFGETTTLRHGSGKWGVLYLLDGVFVIYTIFLYMQKKGQLIESKIQKKYLGLALTWIFVGLIPAAIGTEIPHANRALLALPGFAMLSVVGLIEIILLTSGKIKFFQISVKKIISLLLFLSYGFLSLGYFQHYFSVFARESENDFYDGYIQAMKFAQQYEQEVDKILFTSEYGQPYIYALFVRKTNPIWYQGGSLVKFEFSDKINEGDLQRKKTIIVATENQIDPKFGDELILSPNGKVKFVLIKPRD